MIQTDTNNPTTNLESRLLDHKLDVGTTPLGEIQKTHSQNQQEQYVSKPPLNIDINRIKDET